MPGKKSADITGQKFNRLTAVELVRHRNRPSWKCLCDCGNYSIVRTDSLKNRRVISCGCYKSEETRKRFIKKTDKVCANQIYLSYKSRAKKTKKSFNITFEDFYCLAKLNCYYCNSLPKNKIKGKYPFIYNGLDRLDNNLGYELYNIVPCCWFCNEKKKETDIMDFKAWIDIVHHRLKGVKFSNV